AQPHAAAISRSQQGVVSLAQTDFPREAGIFDRGERGSAGAAVESGYRDHIRARFGDTSGDDSHAGAGYKLDSNSRERIHGAQIVNQLREVFDAVDVVVWRR